MSLQEPRILSEMIKVDSLEELNQTKVDDICNQYIIKRANVMNRNRDTDKSAFKKTNKYKKIKESESKDSICSICFDCFETGRYKRILTCGHNFHKKCIDTWLNESNTCPLCTRVLF